MLPERKFVQSGRALVIGNEEYEHTLVYEKLKRCKADADAIALELSKGRFRDVQKRCDLNRNDMEEAVANWLKKEADCVWLHFSGHGEATDSEVFLIPVDSNGETRKYKLSDVLEKVRPDVELVIVTLDMCQTPPAPPVEGSRGGSLMEAVRSVTSAMSVNRGGNTRLDRVMKLMRFSLPSLANRDLLIFTASERGKVVEDAGLFTEKLAQFLPSEDRELMEMVRWVANEVVKASHGKQQPGSCPAKLKREWIVTRPSSKFPSTTLTRSQELRCAELILRLLRRMSDETKRRLLYNLFREYAQRPRMRRSPARPFSKTFLARLIWLRSGIYRACQKWLDGATWLLQKVPHSLKNRTEEDALNSNLETGTQRPEPEALDPTQNAFDEPKHRRTLVFLMDVGKPGCGKAFLVNALMALAEWPRAPRGKGSPGQGPPGPKGPSGQWPFGPTPRRAWAKHQAPKRPSPAKTRPKPSGMQTSHGRSRRPLR
ncbi:unnamed protein product [Symbiodinium natans]|uniref:Peptidase C14 caspase domain-containing protein n=1 Tax=Symbiodinium natans TaxID=878477 RepID=A0A812UWB7_9DINO|nr:unnamed protein product [Symbiodinium natans]